jgi:hypothetical protein
MLQVRQSATSRAKSSALRNAESSEIHQRLQTRIARRGFRVPNADTRQILENRND